MNERQMEIVRCLEETYTGARAQEDVETMIRVSRAIAAFESNIQGGEETIFIREFLDEYYSRV